MVSQRALARARGVADVADAPLGGIDTEADLEQANADWMSFTMTHT